MSSVEADMAALKASIAKYEGLFDAATTLDERRSLLDAITAKQNTLTELMRLSDGGAFGVVFDHSKYPFFYKPLREIGLTTPWEQYTLYGSIATAIVASFKPLRKGYYLNKWINETDEVLKIIWAGKGQLLDSEMQAGKAYLNILRQTPRRWALLPITFCFFEGLKFGYRKLFKR